MKKFIAAYLIVSTFILSPALQARSHSAPRVILADAYSPDDQDGTAENPNDPVQDDQQTPENPPDETTPSEPAPEPEEASTIEEATDNQGTPVSAASESTNKEKSNRWRNIIIAVVAVAVAITALFLIQENNGHRN